MLIPNGYSTVFVVSLAFAVIGVAVLALLVPDLRAGRPRSGKGGPKIPALSFRWRMLREPGLGRLLIVAGILGLLTVGDGFIYLVLQDKNSFAVQWFPLLYVGTNLVFLVLAVPLGRLADRWGKAKVFISGHAALLACYLLTAMPFAGIGPTLGCLLLLGVFYAATDGVLAALASQLTPPERLATGIGAAQTVVAVSRMAASAGFGILWFALGPATAMVVVGCMLTVAVLASPFILNGIGHEKRVA
jgi:predicted MFS family arabinose efflux permease